MLRLVKLFLNLCVFAMMIGAGLVGARFITEKQQPLTHEPLSMAPRPVEVISVARRPYVPTVITHGTIEPSVNYEGRAQVSGKISYIHPDLREGGSIPAGTVVLEIDPTDYQTSLDQAKADLMAAKSQLAQLQEEEKNTKRSLAIAQQNLRNEQQNTKNVQRKAAPIGKNTALIQRNIQLERQNFTIIKQNLQLAKNDLNLAQRNLALANKEMARISELGKRRLIPLSQVDNQEAAVLQQQQQVSQQRQQIMQLEQSLVQKQQAIVQLEQQLTQQDQSVASQDQNVLQQQQSILQYQKAVTELQGQLNTFASRLSNLLAQITRADQQVKGQNTTLQRTKITMPFDARISAASLDKGEYVAVGNVLFEAINIDGVEVRADIPLHDMSTLLTPLLGQPLDFSSRNSHQVLQDLQLKARVKLVSSHNSDTNQTAYYGAQVSRISESVDPVLRTIDVVITIDKPNEHTIIGERPPLLKGMYVRVEIMSPPLEALVIPRHAVHQGRVYVLNPQQQLEIRPIEVLARDSLNIVVASGLAAGEQLVVNDLVPVIPGMPLVDRSQLLTAATQNNAAPGADPALVDGGTAPADPVVADKVTEPAE